MYLNSSAEKPRDPSIVDEIHGKYAQLRDLADEKVVTAEKAIDLVWSDYAHIDKGRCRGICGGWMKSFPPLSETLMTPRRLRPSSKRPTVSTCINV